MLRAATFATAALFLMNLPAEAREVSCAAGQKLKALKGEMNSTITFTNRTPDKQTVYWVDYEGKRHKYQELDPGESYDQPTFLTHPWLITGLRDKCVGYYLSEGKQVSVEPGIAPVIKPIVKNTNRETAAKPEERVAVRKPVEVPAAEEDSRANDLKSRTEPSTRRRTGQSDDDDTRLARRRLDPADDNNADDDFEEDDLAGERDPDDERDREDDRDLDEDDVAIVEPMPRKRTGRSTLSPEWGDDTDSYDRSPLARNWRCGDYSSPTELVICDNRKLTRLDDELNKLYGTLIRQLPRFQRRKLRRNQRRWLRNRNDCGRRSSCIELQTERRLARLNDRLERTIRRRNGLGFNTRLNDNGDSGNRRRVGRRGLPIGGLSLGGNVREAPGIAERQIANLREGDRVTVIENTGEQYQGYDWFKIRFRGRTGYQWGGVLCTERRVPGVFQVCR